MTRTAILVAALFIAAAATAQAEEPSVPLAAGAGRDVVESNCGACHSLDYIRTNAPFMTQKVWEAEVGKMIKAFGAPIEPADAKTIVDYLTRNYGVPG